MNLFQIQGRGNKLKLVRLHLFSLVICVCGTLLPEAQAAGLPWNLGTPGGELVMSQRAQPKTFNPVTAMDSPSRDIIRRMMGDLIVINRETQETEPGLAASWSSSKDGLHYTLKLREGLHFSDGHPFDADDVVFSFSVYLDEKTNSPQRDLLIVHDQPIRVVKLDAHTVRFDLAGPYAAAERIFDSLAMLPRHLLETPWKEGRLAQAWTPGVKPGEIAGMGPFRLKEYKSGESVVLERNPWYWKHDSAGTQLPYLDSLRFTFVADENAQVLRFAGGATNVLSRFGARTLSLLPPGSFTELGASLEYSFLFFNQRENAKPWFHEKEFRQAISAALDRDAIVRLVFGGHATPLWSHVPPANKRWVNSMLPKPAKSLDAARKLLAQSGYTWNSNKLLVDPRGTPVEFSLAVNAGNEDRAGMATVIQEDLRQLGIVVRIATLEFRSMLDRIMRTGDFDAAIMSLGGGDADPNAEMNVWLSRGGTHLWNPEQKQPATGWEAEIDHLMKKQAETLNYPARKRLFDRLQEIEAEQLPIISLVSPNLLVAAKPGLGNFRPSVLDHYTLWNCEYLYWHAASRMPPAPGGRPTR